MEWILDIETARPQYAIFGKPLIDGELTDKTLVIIEVQEIARVHLGLDVKQVLAALRNPQIVRDVFRKAPRPLQAL